MNTHQEKISYDVHADDSVKNIVSDSIEFVIDLISNEFCFEFVSYRGFLGLFSGWSVYYEFTAEQIQGAWM
jgi:hypothetical protein